jgi:hypothetical protein
MSTLPPLNERTAAEIGWLLDRLPRDQAGEVLQRNAVEYFSGAVAKGWPPDQARTIAIDFVRAVCRHWGAAATCRLQ